jgi:ketosteroid isomerase-like protein
MADREATERLLSELYRARLAGQLEPLVQLFTAEARFRISGASDGKPITISAQGTQEIRSWLAMLLKSIRLQQQQMLSTCIDGERAAVHWRAVVHSKVTGAQQPTEFVDLIAVRAGRIAAYTEFFLPA